MMKFDMLDFSTGELLKDGDIYIDPAHIIGANDGKQFPGHTFPPYCYLILTCGGRSVCVAGSAYDAMMRVYKATGRPIP